eukprot:15354404-Ditylum_brightwellii.AAC.1
MLITNRPVHRVCKAFRSVELVNNQFEGDDSTALCCRFRKPKASQGVQCHPPFSVTELYLTQHILFFCAQHQPLVPDHFEYSVHVAFDYNYDMEFCDFWETSNFF